MPTDWRVYGKDTVAYRLDKSEMPGFFDKEIVVGPGEFALVIENGQLKGAISQEREKVAGLWDSFLGMFKRSADVEVVFVTAAEFEVVIDLAQEDLGTATLAATSADGQPVTAQCKFVLQVPEARAHQVAVFMAGRKALAASDVAEAVRTELIARVLLPHIREHGADELASNADVQGQLVGIVREEFGRLFGTRGLALNDFIVLWGMSEGQKEELKRQRHEREARAIEFEHDRKVRDVMREREIEEMRLANLQALKSAEQEGNVERKELLLASEVRMAEKRGEYKVNRALVEAQIEETRIEVDRKRKAAELEQDRQGRLLDFDMQERDTKLRMAEADASSERDMDDMTKLLALKMKKDEGKNLREIQRLRAEAEVDCQRKKQENEARYQELLLKHQAQMERIRMQSEALSKSLDAGVATSQTVEKAFDTSTTQQALEGDVEKLRIVAGGGQPQQESRCPGCQEPVKPDWKACPACGAKLDPPPACPACGKDVQSRWKACPFCGEALEQPKCPGCGGDVEANWKACPACGRALA